MLKGVDHIGIAVNDLNASLPFYTEKLGLKVIDRFEIPGRVQIVMLELGNARIELLQYTEPLEERRNRGRTPGLGHLAINVSSIAKEMERLMQEGISFIDQTPRTIPSGARVAFFQGPDNVLIELVEDIDVEDMD